METGIDEAIIIKEKARSNTLHFGSGSKQKNSLKICINARSQSYNEIPREINKISVSFPEEFIKQYEVLEKIGEGFQASVYKVKVKKSNEFFAAKNYQTFDDEIIQKIKKEKTLLSSLNFKNIIKFLNYFTDEKQGIYIILTEYCPYISLKAFIETSNYEMHEHLFKELALTIFKLHKKKILHRDLNVENILVCPQTLNFKIIDFGVAVSLEKSNFATNDEGNLMYRLEEKEFSLDDPWKIDFWGLTVIYLSLKCRRVLRAKQARVILREDFDEKSQNYELLIKKIINYKDGEEEIENYVEMQ